MGRIPRGLAVAVGLASACGGSSSAPSGEGDDGSAPAGDDASVEAGPMAAPCALSLAGDPVPIVSFSNRHATAPSMAVLDTGATSGAASVAVQVFANAGNSGMPDDIEIARARVAPPWPAGAALDEAPEEQGEFALGPGQLAVTGDAPRTLALAWHRDNAAVGVPQFRSIDPASWVQSGEVAIAPSGDAVFSLVAGAGVATDGSWSGDGFAVAWRSLGAPDVGPARPIGALLDRSGAVLRGPTPLATGEDYPGRSPSLVWTGSSYLVATTYDACQGGDACRARSVVVQQLAAGPSADASSAVLLLRPVAAFAAADPSATPGTGTSMAAYGGRVWLAWTEGVEDAGAARTVRLAALDASGAARGTPVVVAVAAHPVSHVAVSAGDTGVLLTWAEDASADDGGAGDTIVGASFVVVQRVGLDGTLDAPLRIPATRVDDYGPPTSAVIAAPRGALVLWAGRSTDPAHFDVTYLARLDCAP